MENPHFARRGMSEVQGEETYEDVIQPLADWVSLRFVEM